MAQDMDWNILPHMTIFSGLIIEDVSKNVPSFYTHASLFSLTRSILTPGSEDNKVMLWEAIQCLPETGIVLVQNMEATYSDTTGHLSH